MRNRLGNFVKSVKNYKISGGQIAGMDDTAIKRFFGMTQVQVCKLRDDISSYNNQRNSKSKLFIYGKNNQNLCNKSKHLDKAQSIASPPLDPNEDIRQLIVQQQFILLFTS